MFRVVRFILSADAAKCSALVELRIVQVPRISAIRAKERRSDAVKLPVDLGGNAVGVRDNHVIVVERGAAIRAVETRVVVVVTKLVVVNLVCAPAATIRECSTRAV